MEYAEFEARVRDRADVDADDARLAIEATLTTLSERVPDADARDLAEQLPGEVGNHLTAADHSASFGYREFLARVLEREGHVDGGARDAAERHARAVVATLLEATDPRESNDLLVSLTHDYEPLFELVDPEAVWGPGWRERLGQHG